MVLLLVGCCFTVHVDTGIVLKNQLVSTHYYLVYHRKYWAIIGPSGFITPYQVINPLADNLVFAIESDRQIKDLALQG